MSIEKSENYTADLAARKLFSRLTLDMQVLSRCVENLTTAASAMRLAIGDATLTLAEVEALHVAQSHAKRTHDALLFEAQTRLGDMIDAANLKTVAVRDLTASQALKIGGLLTQANRINERDVVDDEPNGPLPGLEYVDASYFCSALECSRSRVNNLIEKGVIPKHDALDTEGDSDRPKYLWLKHKAAAAACAVPMPKKGVAALI